MDSRGRILLVEDDEGAKEFMSMALSQEGYEVAVALDGFTALQLVETFKPGLIFLDMRMPLMGGEEFLKVYRALPGSQAGIVAQSASYDFENSAKELAVDYFLSKPFDLDDLLMCAEQYMHPCPEVT
jgi:two-component system response regulator (stage 0 sporulation protein F)